MAEKQSTNGPHTVGEALALAHETQEKLKQADEILRGLTDAGVRKPAILSELVEPTAKIRDMLKREIEVLNDLVLKFEARDGK